MTRILERNSPNRRQTGSSSPPSSSTTSSAVGNEHAIHAVHLNHHSSAAKTLFIGDLSVNTTADGLSKHFHKYGNVTYVLLPKNENTNKSQGFGYIEFNTADEAKKAFEAEQGKPIGGNPCFLDYVGSLWHEDKEAV